jgi:hypothetical protein
VTSALCFGVVVVVVLLSILMAIGLLRSTIRRWLFPTCYSTIPSIRRHVQNQAYHVSFDTYKLVQVLESSGFPRKQAQVLSDILVGVTNESMRNGIDSLASKNDFATLRSELQILEKADFQVLKSDLQLLEMKLQTSVAHIHTEMERIENRVIKWVIGATGTVCALVMGFLRLGIGGGGGGASNTPPPVAVEDKSS